MKNIRKKVFIFNEIRKHHTRNYEANMLVTVGLEPELERDARCLLVPTVGPRSFQRSVVKGLLHHREVVAWAVSRD